MMGMSSPDKFSAIWVSHSSISDFLECPRAYYLKNVYKDPKTGHKIQLTSPALALGQTVHEVLESLSLIPTQNRFSENLIDKFDKVWTKVSGIKGGFRNEEVEQEYKNRGIEMLQRIIKNPGPINNLSVKIREDLPYYFISEEDNIILCGKIDWLEYLPETDSVHIIDFKTGKAEEDGESLQLPIYHLLVHNCQKRKVTKASYWYLGLYDELTPKSLVSVEEAHDKVLSIARKIKTARKLEIYKCPQVTGCRACKPYEAIVRGDAQLVGINTYNQDIYILDRTPESNTEDSVLL